MLVYFIQGDEASYANTTIEDVLTAIRSRLEDAHAGDRVRIEVVEMTEEELNDLPEV